MKISSYFDSLSPIQKEAVSAPLESRLVLAGPGTGKTRTLVHRIAYLISELKLSPEQILAVTYTNKATEEMRNRLRLMLPNEAPNISVGTFHSFCIRTLRQHHDKIGLGKHFGIANEEIQLLIIKKIAPIIKDRKDAKLLLSKITSYRLLGIIDKSALSDFEQSCLEAYKKELQQNSLIDFDDILLLTEKLFIEQVSILEQYKNQLKTILVDEFQDTDRAQYRILKYLTGYKMPVFAVADDDQSIFAWRGAHPQNIRDFVIDFLPNDQAPYIIKLEENYRCSGSIVTLANKLIEPSRRLFDKIPKAINEEGLPVTINTYETDLAEAENIANQIKTLCKDSNTNHYRDMAILYRRHQIGELLELTLLQHGIPCQIIRGTSLFDAKTVRRILALIQIQINPKDEITLQLVINEFLDDLVKLRVEEDARNNNSSLRTALWRRLRASNSNSAERRQIGRLVGMLTTAKTIAENDPKPSLYSWVESINLYLSNITSPAENNPYTQYTTDPLKNPILEKAARWIQKLSTSNGKLFITAENPAYENCAVLILSQLLDCKIYAFNSINSNQNSFTLDETPKLLLTLDQTSEQKALTKHQFTAIIAIQDDDIISQNYSLPKLELPLKTILSDEPQFSSKFALIWKLGQAYQGLNTSPFLPDYTVLDIETTDLDVDHNDVVEIAAIRVRNGIIVDEFSTLVKPCVPINPSAKAVHGITEEMVAKSQTFEQLAEQFHDFLGNDILVAHNGLGFDFQILIRLFKKIGLKLNNSCFDTLQMARGLYPTAKRVTLESLAAKFQIDPGSSHRALDDTRTLAHVFERMKEDYCSNKRCQNGYEALAYLSISMLLEMDREQAVKSNLYKLGENQWPLINTEEIIKELEKFIPQNDNHIVKRLYSAWENINQKLAEKIKSTKENQETESYAYFLEILKGYNNKKLEEAMQEFIDLTKLFQQQDHWKKRNAVTLMTIHAAKGLEFPYVWIAALEQGVLPSYQAVKSEGRNRNTKIDEERRLLYVAMTRAQHKLTLSHAKKRNEYYCEPSMFLSDISTTANTSSNSI